MSAVDTTKLPYMSGAPASVAGLAPSQLWSISCWWLAVKGFTSAAVPSYFPSPLSACVDGVTVSDSWELRVIFGVVVL